MSLIWKRPDGYREALPSDFYVVDINGDTKIWLHKTDKKNYPFRISSGWQEEELTEKINQLTNLIGKSDDTVLDFLNSLYADSNAEKTTFLKQLLQWLKTLDKDLKGDHWEVSILKQVFAQIRLRINLVEATFLHERS